MKKAITVLVLFLGIAMTSVYANAAQKTENPITTNPAGNPVDQFTGVYWQKTSTQEKLAYLFGIDSAVTVEYFINSKEAAASAKTGKKPGYTISPFEKGWMEAFTGITRQQAVDMVDKWYADHPDSLERPVLGVIWYEVIVPRLAHTTKK